MLSYYHIYHLWIFQVIKFRLNSQLLLYYYEICIHNNVYNKTNDGNRQKKMLSKRVAIRSSQARALKLPRLDLRPPRIPHTHHIQQLGRRKYITPHSCNYRFVKFFRFAVYLFLLTEFILCTVDCAARMPPGLYTMRCGLRHIIGIYVCSVSDIEFHSRIRWMYVLLCSHSV